MCQRGRGFKKSGVKLFAVLMLVIAAGIWSFQGTAYSDRGGGDDDTIPLIKVGDNFPETELFAPRAKTDKEYLGIAGKTGFYLKEVKADAMVVEFMNIHCLHCKMQAPILDKVYGAIEKDPDMKGRVKLLSIGVGNREKDMEKFRKEKKVPFPMVPDKDFVAMENIGYPDATPFIMILKRENGNFVVKYAQKGMIKTPEGFLDRIHKLLTGVALAKTKQNYKSAYHLMNPHMTKEKVRKMFVDRLVLLGYKVEKITRLKIKVRKPQKVFSVKVKKGNTSEMWFAVVGAEGKICDVCHDVYFIYVFDRKGTVRDLLPIQFPKKGNKLFNEAEVEKTRKSFVGKSVLKPVQFNEETDAVTSATMTSALIFKSIKQGKDIYIRLKKEGYMK